MTDDLAAAFRQASTVAELKAINDRLMRRLERAKDFRADMVDAVYRAVRDAVGTLVLPPIPRPKPDRRQRTAEVAVAVLGDLQLGKRTPTYGVEACERRVRQFAAKVIEITELQRTHHPVRRVVVPVLGDLLEGGDIFPGQVHQIEASLYRQLCVDGPRVLYEFLCTLLAAFDEVEVVWVCGNHGRVGMKGAHDPETNADRMLGRIIRTFFELAHERRITWTEPAWGDLGVSDDDATGPDPRRAHGWDWYSILRIGAYSALCIHGDQVRGHSGYPWYGLAKRVNSWAAGAIPEPFGDVYLGHWHQINSIALNKRVAYANGSTESYNVHAQETLASMSDPAQWLLFVHPERVHPTAEYRVWLT